MLAENIRKLKASEYNDGNNRKMGDVNTILDIHQKYKSIIRDVSVVSSILICGGLFIFLIS